VSDPAGWTVTVDRDRCIGSGLCVVYAPGTFVHDDAVKAVVADPITDDLDAVRTAVEACPTRALHLVTHEHQG
jgi:ferredoxin